MSRGIEEAVLRRTSPSLWRLPTRQRCRLDTVLLHMSAQAFLRVAGEAVGRTCVGAVAEAHGILEGFGDSHVVKCVLGDRVGARYPAAICYPSAWCCS